MTLLDLGISIEDRERLLRGLHEGKYNLLLGAGSSYGALGGDGEELKDGVTLARQICSEFKLELNSDESKRLPLVYEEAETEHKAAFHHWLKRRFVGCKPTWQHRIFGFYWKRIWTFNIDDVLENSFGLARNDNLRSDVLAMSWKDDVIPLDMKPDSQQIIYLHGRASLLEKRNGGIVFSITQYADATRTMQQWHAAFQTYYVEDPFIVCGASLVEEVDIEKAIRAKNFSTNIGFPSFIVSFGLDEGQKKRMRRFNLIPIVCPLEDFFSVLKQELSEYQRSVVAAATRLKPGTFERFLAQFRRLDQGDFSATAIEGTDFYGGDEPTWKDILDGKDVIFYATQKALEKFDQNSDRYAVLLHGDEVSGKSTALFRVARHAMSEGYKPFWFRHEEGFNAEIAADYLANDERAILFIDDAGNHIESVGRMLNIAKTRKAKARIFLTIRSSRIRGFRVDVADEFRKEVHFPALNRGDLFKLVIQRRKASRLGNHFRRSDADLVKKVAPQGKLDLLECISLIEFSEPIRARVRRIILRATVDARHRNLIATIACVHRFGFSLPLKVALLSSGLEFDDFQSVLSGPL